MEKYEHLKLENQLCFPLYACSKEVIRRYKPVLDELDLTYTQYITMMVLWEEGETNVKELGRRLFLDSGTLTPLLKKLETKGYITRRRSMQDERSVTVSITPSGMQLREQALSVPVRMEACIRLSQEEASALCQLLHRILDTLDTDITDDTHD